MARACSPDPPYPTAPSCADGLDILLVSLCVSGEAPCRATLGPKPRRPHGPEVGSPPRTEPRGGLTRSSSLSHTHPGQSFRVPACPTAPLFSTVRATTSVPFLSGQYSDNPLREAYGLEPYSKVSFIVRTLAKCTSLRNVRTEVKKKVTKSTCNPAAFPECGRDVALIVQLRAGRGPRVLRWRAVHKVQGQQEDGDEHGRYVLADGDEHEQYGERMYWDCSTAQIV